MANLYDSPAQAKFINTYVPIQFEHMYKLTDKISSNLEQGEQLMDQVNQYRSLGSVSETANKLWEDKIYGRIQREVDNNVTSLSDLSNPRVLSRLRSAIRSISSDPLAKNLLASKDAYNETLAKADPRWGDTYREMISQHNPEIDGIWNNRPLDYSSWGEKLDELTKDLKPKVIDTQGFYDVMGIAESDIMSIIAQNRGTILSNPENLLLAETEIRRMEDPSRYISKTEDGQLYVDAPKYIEDAIRSAAADKLANRELKENNVRLHQDRERRAEIRHAATLDAKKQEQAVNSYTKSWLNSSFVNSTFKKMQLASNAVASEMAKHSDSKEQEKAGRAVLGDGFYNYYMNQQSISASESEMRNLVNQRSQAAASQSQGANPNYNSPELQKINNRIAELDKAIKLKSAANEYHMQDVNNALELEAEKVMNGQPSKLGTREQIMYTNQQEVDQMATALWSDMQVGPKSKIVQSNNVSKEVYQVRNSTDFVIADPRTLSPNRYSVGANNAQRASIKSATGKVSGALRKNTLAGGSYWEPGTKAILTGNGSMIQGNMYIPEYELTKIGLTPEEIDALASGAMTGSSSVIGRPLSTSDMSSYSTTVRFVAIPMLTEFATAGESTSNTMLDAMITKETKGSFNPQD